MGAISGPLTAEHRRGDDCFAALERAISKGDWVAAERDLGAFIREMEQHFTVGWTRARANGHQFTLSLMYAPEKKITGPSLFDPLQTVTLSMNQFEMEFAYRFGSGR